MAGKTRVVIAMSGGVDSSVAAARLVDQGFDVVGVTLHLWDYPDDGSERGRCCAPEDQHDARRVADVIGIPHFTFDRRELFQQHVVGPFVDAYLHGETPSPCIACNRSVKLRELFPLADRLGAELVATGHYARVALDPPRALRASSLDGAADGPIPPRSAMLAPRAMPASSLDVAADGPPRARLLRGKDAQKDQSYFLYMLREDELRRLTFPLGDSTKGEVRAEAVARKLPGATKGESQELCFVSSGHYAEFVERRADGRVRPGPILAPDGRAVGEHAGVHGFTIGQRKGLGVALGKPMFVAGIDGATGAVQLGEEADLLADGLRIDEAAWSDDVTFPLRATVRVRSRHEGAEAVIERAPDGGFVAWFLEPVRAVSPGQVAVAHVGDRVFGGGPIVKALRRATADNRPPPADNRPPPADNRPPAAADRQSPALPRSEEAS